MADKYIEFTESENPSLINLSKLCYIRKINLGLELYFSGATSVLSFADNAKRDVVYEKIKITIIDYTQWLT